MAGGKLVGDDPWAAFNWVKAAFDLLKMVFNWVDGIQLDEMPGTYIRDLYCLCDISRQSTYVLSLLQREMPESFGIVLLCKTRKG